MWAIFTFLSKLAMPYILRTLVLNEPLTLSLILPKLDGHLAVCCVGGSFRGREDTHLLILTL